MAKFFPPKASTTLRESATPLDGEFLYDATEKAFYGGDGTTPGGVPVTPPATGGNTPTFATGDIPPTDVPPIAVPEFYVEISISGSSPYVALWVGIATDGNVGNNGWVKNDNFYT